MTDELYSKKLPVIIRIQEHEDRKSTIRLAIEVSHPTPSISRKELVVRLTDEKDPFFLFTLRLSEDDYKRLKVEQGLLVDFGAFPQKFIDLLEVCLQEEHKEVPKFVVHLVCNGSSLMCAASLNIIETNPFKHLNHLSLKFLSGTDADIKCYLAECLKTLQEQNATLMQRFEHTESDLSMQLRQARETVLSQTQELMTIKADRTTKLNEMTNIHMQEMNMEKEKSLQMTRIKLQSSDGDIFEVDVDIAKQSVVVKTMLEDLGMDEGEDEPVPLPNVNAAILKKVIQWCTYHKDNPAPAEDDENKEKRTDDICSWDMEFLKVDQGTLFELILAANYLDIKKLLDVTCKTVANMIKGKTPEEIRKTFNIKNDFTPAEEEQMNVEFIQQKATAANEVTVKVKKWKNLVKAEEDHHNETKVKLQEAEKIIEKKKTEELKMIDQIQSVSVILQELHKGEDPEALVQKLEQCSIEEVTKVIQKSLEILTRKERELEAELHELKKSRSSVEQSVRLSFKRRLPANESETLGTLKIRKEQNHVYKNQTLCSSSAVLQSKYQTATESSPKNVPFIDAHCHLDLIFKKSGFFGTFKEYKSSLAETFPGNFQSCVTVFCHPLKWISYVKEDGLMKRLLSEDDVFGVLGCHPKNAPFFSKRREGIMKELIKHPRIRAVGEIGLDFSGGYHKFRDVQIEVLQRQVVIAVQLNKPLVIHAREAETDIVKVLEKLVPSTYKIHRHCFLGSWREAEAWLHKFPRSVIGLTPAVTYAQPYTALHELMLHLPLDKLVIETDAPYFRPAEVPRSEMQMSHPAMAVTVAVEVAKVKNVPVEVVLSACLHNTKEMYSLD